MVLASGRLPAQGASDELCPQPVSQGSSGAETQAAPVHQASLPVSGSESVSGRGGSGVPPSDPYRHGDGGTNGNQDLAMAAFQMGFQGVDLVDLLEVAVVDFVVDLMVEVLMVRCCLARRTN